MPTKPRTIGLLGGSFNPAHAGHVHVSVEAMKQLGLDEVWWLVSPQNPLKPTEGMAPFEERFEAAKKVARHPRITVSDFEQLYHTQYTADTLRKLKLRYPRIRFVWLMGADNLATIHHWQDWKSIFSMVHIAVYDRAPYTLKALSSLAALRYKQAQTKPTKLTSNPLPAWCLLWGKRHPLSATFIRNLLDKK
jgi:nicotinate-nucleotide adenylyltransferase